MKKFFVKTLAMLLVCMFVISGINFSIFASDTISPGNLEDKLVAMNVELSGRVKMLFYFTNTDNVERYNVEIVEIKDEEKRLVPVKTVYVKNMATSDDKNGVTRRVLEVSLAAAQQSVDVVITPYAADGTAGKPRTYSVMDYVNMAITQGVDEKAVNALKSMLNYGAMAQKAFEYNEDNLANDGLYFGNTNPVNNMSIDDIYGVKKMEKNATDPSALDLGNVNAHLKESISLKFYLEYTCAKENLKVTIEGEDCGNEVFTDENGDYVLIDNIPATKFNHQYTIKVTDGNNTLTIKSSVLNYVKSMIAMDGTAEAEEFGITEADMNAARAMFQYYAKMWEYVNKAEPVGKPDPSTCDHKRSYVDTKLGHAEICSDCGKDITPTNIVENANDLANGVTTYFGTAKVVNREVQKVVDKDRKHYAVWNGHANVYYPLTHEEEQNLTVTNKNGGVYVQNTMDVYVKTANGTYWSSNSAMDAEANIYRYGYYYYDIHAYGQNFVEDNISTDVLSRKAFSLQPFAKESYYFNSVIDFGYKYSFYGDDISCDSSDAQNVYDDSNGTTAPKFTIASTADPQICTQGITSGVSVSSSYVNGKYNAMEIQMTLDSTTQVQMRYTTSSSDDFGETHRIDFDTYSGTNTYTVYFEEDVPVYNIRFDFNGQVGEEITIHSIDFVAINTGTSPKLLLDRGFHTYTDKMHQVLSIVAPAADVHGIEEIGMTTKIAKSTVGSWIVKSSSGTSQGTNADTINISNVEYAGFYINGVGVFGYILPKDDKHSGTIKITDDGTNYVITQAITPDGGTIYKQDTLYSSSELASKYPDFVGTSLNIYNSPTAFYFGQRIYTDATDASKLKENESVFDAFLKEAYIERNPLTAENIKIDTDKTPNATFDGYDGIRGMYAFTIPENIGFNAGYYYAQNFHGAVSFSITGDNEYDRNMYVMAYSYGSSVEGGAVLDKDDTLLPIPTEVSKNFDHEFEEPIWLWGDVGYSEVRIPVKVNKGETEEFTVLQTYMNWGQYPLKQISSIQFFAPYYHLSTGTTESNCIANYYVHGKDLQTLPDHRAASAPFWSDLDYDRDGNGTIEGTDQDGDGFNEGDPQHDNAGFHKFLQYTDRDGNKVASEPVSSVINSAGLTYADIDMTYRSDDNKIEVTYKHLEMPQTDENRAYYEIKYKVLSDVTIENFANNFSFYSAYGYGNGYRSFSYWNGSESVKASADTKGTYTLGELTDTSENSYFTLYNIDNLDTDDTGYTETQSANVSFLIDSYKLPNSLSGSKFIVNVANRTASLSLNKTGTVKLEAGDEIVIYAIIMPWGYNLSTSNFSSDDSLVQAVRENTLVNPIVATPVGENTSAVENVFLPTVKTTNGLDAEFTIGHTDANNAPKTREDMGINVTFRVDGFKVLTTPKLYEKVDGTWELKELSSINTPDKTGSSHNYDGYFVHYNSDGTYSYSFVTNINGSSRTFRVRVDDTYVEWEENHTDLYFGADTLYHFASHGSALTAYQMSENGVDFVRLTNGGTNDPATAGFKMPGGSAARYMVLKYRLDDPDSVDPNQFDDLNSDEYKAAVAKDQATDSGLQFFMTTYGVYDGGYNDGINDGFTLDNSIIVSNNEWQVMVVDLAALVAETGIGGNMIASSVGTYSLSSFRFDPFTVISDYSLDVSYIAFCNDIYEAVNLNPDMDISDISYVSGTSKSTPISDELAVRESYANMNAIFVGNSLKNEFTDNRGDTGITSAVVNSDGTVTVNFASGNNDEYFTVYITGGVETGKYLVMKYKIGEGLTSADGSFWAMAYYNDTTTNTGHVKNYGLKADGEWHTLVMDLTKLGTGVTATDGKYYVTAFRTDMFDALSADGSVDFEYIGFCDELTDIPSDEDETLEYSANFIKCVDNLYVDGGSDKNQSATSVTGTVLDFAGWAGVAGLGVDGISYVVTDASGHETVVSLSNSKNGSNIYYVGDENIQKEVAELGEGTVGYSVKFRADLTEWNGQTVKLSIRATVDGIAAVDVYSVTVTVPKAEDPEPEIPDVEDKDPSIIYHSGYISGSDIHNKVNTNWHKSKLNSDGSVTITEVGVTTGDAYIMLTDYAKNLTPKYAIMRYKTTDENSLTVLASSGSKEGGPWTSCSLITDGEWHTVVVDLTTVNNSGFVYSETVSFLRLDLCEDTGSGQSITIDYVLLCDDSNMPVTVNPNYFSGDEIASGLLGGFSSTPNSDGSVTIECTASADGTINFKPMINGSPKYAVIRYKNTDAPHIVIYATTQGNNPKENYVYLENDNAWHVVVVDLEAVGTYKAGDTIGDGNYLRFDFLDSGDGSYVEKSLTLDYVWFTDDISKVEYEPYDKLDVSFVGGDLYDQGADHYGDSNTIENGDSQYGIVENDDGTVTVTRINEAGEVYITALFNRQGASAVVTGKYFVIKYRTSASGITSMGSLFASTSAYSATGANDFYNQYKAYNDGEWHVAAFDLSKITNVVDNGDGTYTVNFVRFAFNGLAVGETVDIAYIGLCDSLSDVEAGYDVSFTKDTITSNSNVTLDKTEEILTVTSTGATNDAGRFWVTVPSDTVTGKYIVVRYKYNATNANNGSLVYLNTWTSTTNSAVTGGDNQNVNVLADGEWHTIVIDATKSGTVNAVDGTYSLKYVGFDFFTTSTAHAGDYVEISYIGFSDSLEDIVREHGEVEYDLDYSFTNDESTLGGGTHTWMSSVKTSTSTGGNYNGWATVDGTITGMYYKVVSSTGETEWIECTGTIMGPDHASYTTYNNNSGTARIIWLGEGVDIVNAATMTIPASALSGYASGEVVTIYVAASVDGLDGAYVVLISSEMTIS